MPSVIHTPGCEQFLFLSLTPGRCLRCDPWIITKNCIILSLYYIFIYILFLTFLSPLFFHSKSTMEFALWHRGNSLSYSCQSHRQLTKLTLNTCTLSCEHQSRCTFLAPPKFSWLLGTSTTRNLWFISGFVDVFVQWWTAGLKPDATENVIVVK